jgi:glycosyltransferase involved in cell wall biosynthesis
MSKLPLVTCITPTYNRSRIVPEAIESNIFQTYENWEMIVIDDQSTDDTWNVITPYERKDPRIRCFRNPNKGANNARNLGLEKAKGELIVFLDDDDVNLPHRYESQVNAILKSGSRFILSWFEVRDRSDKFYKKVNCSRLTGAAAHFTVRWMIEKSLLQEVGGFNPKMISMQEIELSYRIAEKYTFEHHDDIVVTVYNDPTSVSKGERGIRGKIMLLDEAGHLIDKEEKAFWYYSIALNYLRINKIEESIIYYDLAAEYSRYFDRYKRFFRSAANFSVKIGSGLWGSRMLSKTIRFKYTKPIEHKVIK